MNSISTMRRLMLISVLAFLVAGISSAEDTDAVINEVAEAVYGVAITNASWVDEWVEVTNSGESAQDLTGWTLKDEQDHTYAFPEGFVLGTGGAVTVHTGVGNDTAANLYCNMGCPIWNNAGDVATLMDADGMVVSQYPEPVENENDESDAEAT
ncbi:MAG TPA: lamin tail domain-containing protein [Methanothrix sp.]|nr:lamin tail domain-containing protein [Methanothrix sp.]